MRNEGRIGVLLCTRELGVHSFPLAKQLLCLPGFQMFTEIKGYISHQLWTNIHPILAWVRQIPSILLSDSSALCYSFKATVAEVHYLNMIRHLQCEHMFGFGCPFSVVVELMFNNS